MEVYILDDQLRRTEVVDRFESLIWTERYTAYGDFELVTHSTSANRSLFPKGTRLALNESSRVMAVETIETKLDSEGKSSLSLSGRSIESILEDRVATDSWGNLTVNPNWKLTGAPAAIARTIFNTICRDGLLSTADKIPFLESVITTQQYTRPEPSDIITVELEHQSVYKSIKDICDAYGLGFYLVRVGDTSKLRFKIFTGNDRTLFQTDFPPVVFSHELDNMENISELQSIEQYKNVCYVFAKNGTAIVYAPGEDSTTASGFNRRVMYIKHDGEEPAGAALTDILNQKGLDALAKARGIFAFDGEIPQRGSYKYGRDYFLGDLVELRNADNVSSRMRVTEQIFTSDSEGDKSYPTLSLDLTATPGSWAAENEPATWSEQTDTWSTAST